LCRADNPADRVRADAWRRAARRTETELMWRGARPQDYRVFEKQTDPKRGYIVWLERRNGRISFIRGCRYAT